MSANGISKLEFKRDRQIAKLNLAASNRTASGRRSTLDISQLPAVYAENNNNTNAVINNLNTGGLQPGRPWIESPPLPPIVTDGLTLWLDSTIEDSYPGTGTTWFDLEKSNDALLTGATYNADKFFEFSGTNNFGRIPSVVGETDFDITDNYTVELWFNPDVDQLPGNEGMILEKWNDNSENRYPYVVRQIKSVDTARFIAFNGSGQPNAQVSAPRGEWTQAVGVFDHSNKQLRVYRNGSLVASTGMNLTNSISNTSAVNIGRRSGAGGASGSGFFKGKMGIVRVYNKSLTLEEIQQNFDADKEKFGL